jgi:pyridoxal phosphate enzyme (YggS family)
MQDSVVAFQSIQAALPAGVTLVVVSKTHPVEAIRPVYEAGARIFGENRVQELLQKKSELPEDIQWHLIGQLQRNKVRAILPHTALIHSVSSEGLFEEIHKEAQKMALRPKILLQVHIAQEDTKSGFSPEDLFQFLKKWVEKTSPVLIEGLMGMATFTEDEEQVRAEFSHLRDVFHQVKKDFGHQLPEFRTLSMGMSGDWRLAVSCGSDMIRVGSSIFGHRSV